MKLQRDRAGSSLTKNGNIWIIGGRNEMEEGLTSTEIYDYRPKGNGKWRKGPNIPKDLPGGLESHCAVRYVKSKNEIFSLTNLKVMLIFKILSNFFYFEGTMSK